MTTKQSVKAKEPIAKATLRNHLNLDTAAMKSLSIDLNNLLADYHIFYQNLRGYHWNVQGGDFFDLHEKFEVLYTSVNSFIDVLAERIVTIGFQPLHTFPDFIEHSVLEIQKGVTKGDDCVKLVLSNLGALIHMHRRIAGRAGDVEDIVTADMLTKFATELEKKLWMFTQFSK